MAAGLQKGKTEETMTRPTPQQIEAYRFVHIHQCSYSEAAKLMGCTRRNVNYLVNRLKKTNPQLFPKNGQITTIRYHIGLNSQIISKF